MRYAAEYTGKVFVLGVLIQTLSTVSFFLSAMVAFCCCAAPVTAGILFADSEFLL